MARDPFLILPVRSCRDLVHARHRARQIAQLLHFDAREIVCIAAGAFAVADQARTLLRRARLCFVLEDQKLRVFAKPAPEAEHFSLDLLSLCKPLPAGSQPLAGEDLSWLVRKVQLLAPLSLQDELRGQNQEALELLAALRSQEKSGQSNVGPSAA